MNLFSEPTVEAVSSISSAGALVVGSSHQNMPAPMRTAIGLPNTHRRHHRRQWWLWLRNAERYTNSNPFKCMHLSAKICNEQRYRMKIENSDHSESKLYTIYNSVKRKRAYLVSHTHTQHTIKGKCRHNRATPFLSWFFCLFFLLSLCSTFDLISFIQ